MKVSEIKAPVSSIAGVVPQITKTLAKVNVFTVGDLLQYFPRDYEDRSIKVYLRDFAKASKVHTVAQVIGQEWFGYGRMKTLKIRIYDGTAQAELICFNRAFLEKSIPAGSIITVTGQFFVKYNALQSSSFEVTKMEIAEDQLPKDPNGRPDLQALRPLDTGILPVYPLTEGLTQKVLHKAIGQAVQQYLHGIEDELPGSLIEKHELLSKQDALRLIHQPQTMAQAIQARKTLAYEELFLFQSVIAQRAYNRKGLNKKADFNSETGKPSELSPENFKEQLSPLQKTFLQSLPFPLTADQQKVIYEMDEEIDRSYTERERGMNHLDRGIPAPLTQAFTMARMLQGDVGSGKTLVSLFACLRIISWKGQCALMAPTEILARQHAETTARLLSPLGVRVAFLTGNVKAAGRNQLIKALKEGEIDIIVGTHALYSTAVEYKDLRLAVIDEQHRFGVMQRQSIINKGRVTYRGSTFEPNLLMMSATPIPQSLALTVFGDLDISTIHTMPAGRKPIQTHLVKEGNEINAYEAVRKELAIGHQAYFVYPAIDSDENIKSAERAFQHLSQHIYPQYKCALVHSKIDDEEQVRILKEFHDGSIQVLAATTVIEVGVDVPNATCMVIEQADHFGMAQLHQLRGRVGRGDAQSFCFLIYSQNLTETGKERMKALHSSTDGFYIAEQDLKTRGPGELNGTLQAGALEFKVADLSRDLGLMEEARNDAWERISTNSR